LFENYPGLTRAEVLDLSDYEIWLRLAKRQYLQSLVAAQGPKQTPIIHNPSYRAVLENIYKADGLAADLITAKLAYFDAEQTGVGRTQAAANHRTQR
jgi:hypothetical protein